MVLRINHNLRFKIQYSYLAAKIFSEVDRVKIKILPTPLLN